MIFARLTILSSANLLTITPLKCISMTNQECKVRPQIVNVNSDEPVFYPFSINPLMTTPRRKRTLFTEIKFCTLCLTIISYFEKIFMWRIGKVENIAVTYT